MDDRDPGTPDRSHDERLLSYEAIRRALDRSARPATSESVYDAVGALGIGPEQLVVDTRAGDGRHALELAARLGCRVLAVGPVGDNVERARTAVGAHPAGHLVDIRRGSIDDLPAPDWSAHCIVVRHLTGHLPDLDVALAECARVLRPDGAIVVLQTFAGPALEPGEADDIYRDLAIVPERMDPAAFEADAESLGFIIRSCEVVGPQWDEARDPDGRGVTADQLVHAARLNRLRNRHVEESGGGADRIGLASARWAAYQMAGKLEPRLYVLGAPACEIAAANE